MFARCSVAGGPGALQKFAEIVALSHVIVCLLCVSQSGVDFVCQEMLSPEDHLGTLEGRRTKADGVFVCSCLTSCPTQDVAIAAFNGI